MQFHQIKSYMQSQLHQCYFNGKVFKIIKQTSGSVFHLINSMKHLPIESSTNKEI